MKRIPYIALLLLCCIASGCAFEKEEGETPYEETYLLNFIKRFGIIDPNQDFNLAETSHVGVFLDEAATKIVVYANAFDHYYRVARCYDVPAGAIDIPIDIPVNTTDLAVDIDGKVYVTLPSARIDTRNHAPMSRTDGDQPYLNENEALGWLIVSEDLGSFDDVDFNDFIARFIYTENAYMAYGSVTPDVWDRMDQNIGTSDIGYIHESRADTSLPGVSGASRVSGTTKITIKSLASGGQMKIWLHYRATLDGDDYVIGPSGSILTSELTAGTAESYEWHTWFGKTSPTMINTGSGSYGPVYGGKTDFEVAGDFTFTTYSQMTYEHNDPKDAYNFNFDRRQIQGFYITVGGYNTDINGETAAAFDVGRAIGHCRELGLPPQMFLIPDVGGTDGGANASRHFKWAKERVSIDEAYTTFDSWVLTGNGEWYKNANSACVVDDQYLKIVYGE